MKIIKLSLIMFLLISFCFSQDKSIGGKIIEVDSGKPIENCMVFLFSANENITDMRLTDKDGNYLFENITGKFYQLTTKHMSYDGAEFGPFRYSKKFEKINFELTPIPFQTSDVVVSAEKIDEVLSKVGFVERKEEGRGEFIDAKEMIAKELDSWSKVVNQLPMLKIAKSGRMMSKKINTSLKNTTNEILIYVDGILTEELDMSGGYGKPTTMDFSSHFNALVDVESVAGIEFYPRANAAPLQYQKMNSTNGILLIWTK